MGEFIVYRSSRRPSVHPHFQTYISLIPADQTQPNLNLKHYLGKEKAASGFGPDRIRTLVSTATDATFNPTSRYLDDLLNIDNPYFEGMVNQNYPPELKLNR